MIPEACLVLMLIITFVMDFVLGYDLKKKQQNDKKILEAYHAGNKSAEEIIAFIMGDKSSENE